MRIALPFTSKALATEPRYSHNTLILFELSLDFRFQHSRNCTTHSFNHNDRLSPSRTFSPEVRIVAQPLLTISTRTSPCTPDTWTHAPLFHYSILRHITRYVSTLLCSTAMIPTLDVPFSKHRPG